MCQQEGRIRDRGLPFAATQTLPKHREGPGQPLDSLAGSPSPGQAKKVVRAQVGPEGVRSQHARPGGLHGPNKPGWARRSRPGSPDRRHQPPSHGAPGGWARKGRDAVEREEATLGTPEPLPTPTPKPVGTREAPWWRPQEDVAVALARELWC